MLKDILRNLLNSNINKTPEPTRAPDVDRFLTNLGIGTIVSTLENATGFKANVSEHTEKFMGDPRITFGYKDGSHTETSKTYVVPLKKTLGKTSEIVSEPIYGKKWIRHTHEFASNSDGHYEHPLLGSKTTKTKPTDLVDNVAISVKTRSDNQDSASIDVSTTKFVPAGKLFKEVVKKVNFDVNLKSVNNQRELLIAITNLLEDMNKK